MRLPAAVIILLFVSGCSSSSFLGKRFDNFTAYYNTFYNARKSFETASKTVKRSDTKIDRSVYLGVIEVANTGQGTRDFENTIKKSADVLRKHPQSKWVDDALLLIGKSYYYTANTVGAEQKFREVIDRSSPLEDEARFWLGLTLISSGAYDQAGEHLRESIEREDVNRKWRSKMQVALGELYVRQELWPEAAEALDAGTQEIKDNALGGRAAFLLGQVYETIGEYGLAAEAYRSVRKFNPVYELAYASRYNAARVEGLYGDVDAALREVRRMERDGKNFAYRAEIAYLRGHILRAAGDIPDAIQVYHGILYDSDANITTVRGPVHYGLGSIYRDNLLDFTLAAAHFDTAATILKGAASRNQALTGRTAEVRPAPGAITDASNQAEVFGTYANLWEKVAHFDSLLYLGSLDDAAFAAKVKEIRRQKAEEMLAQSRLERQRSVAAGFERVGALQEGPATSAAQQSAGPTGTAGFLFHRDRSRVQEGLISFFDRWGERPLVPNWRRQAAIAGQGEAGTSGAEDMTARTTDALPIDASLSADALAASVEVDVSAVPRTEEARAAVRTERAAARYELANVLFLSVELPDSAAAWYRRVVEEDAETAVAARALYALAEVQLSLGDRESAEAIYKQVAAQYPDTDVAERAAERAGIPVSHDVSENDEEAGLEEYRKAFKLWTIRRYQEAMESMLAIAADHPETAVGGRALLAATAIYLDWADSTQTDPLDPIAIDVDPASWHALGLVEPIDAGPLDTVQESSPGVRPDTSHVPGSAPDTLSTMPSAIAEIVRVDTTTARTVAEPMPNDTLEVVSDSADSLPGTAMEAPAVRSSQPLFADSAEVDTDPASVGAGFEQVVYLEQLYDAILDRYSDTDYAKRATVYKAALTQLRAEREAEVAAERQAERPPLSDGETVPPETPGDDDTGAEATFSHDASNFRGALAEKVADEKVAALPQTGIAETQAVDTTGAAALPETPAPPVEVATEVDAEPVPVGGPGAIQRMIRYPPMAREAGVTGEVIVTFVVDQRGRVSDARVVKGLGYGCDQEAVRVINLTRYRPAMKEGRPVAYRLETSLAFGSSQGPPVSE